MSYAVLERWALPSLRVLRHPQDDIETSFSTEQRRRRRTFLQAWKGRVETG